MAKKAVVVSFMTSKRSDTSMSINSRSIVHFIKTILFLIRYVGLCATIKLVALAIFAVDWWLVRRRKQLEYTTPLTATAGVGSIISLDKCESIAPKL